MVISVSLKKSGSKLYGPQGTKRRSACRCGVISALSLKHLNLTITSLVLNDRRAWQIIVDNGIRLELGKESLEERIERFISLFKNLGSETERVSYIDLRYDTGASIGWFPEQELEQENTDD